MADCPNLLKCPFFSGNMEHMPSVTGYLKRQFCHDIFMECARYRVASELGSQAVPENMFPHERSRASEIIAKARYARKG